MTWISYLTPITIYHGITARSTLIEVREVFGQRKMDLNGYPQSGSWYRRMWRKMLQQRRDREKVLLLGLGGGDVVKLITNYQTNVTMTVVELENEVVQVAKDYFGITPSENLQIITEDAKAYLERNKQNYDLIIVDLYDGDGIPKFVTTKKFLIDVKRTLEPCGQAIFNYASHSFRVRDFASFERKLKKIFSVVEQIRIWGHTFYVMQK